MHAVDINFATASRTTGNERRVSPTGYCSHLEAKKENLKNSRGQLAFHPAVEQNKTKKLALYHIF